MSKSLTGKPAPDFTIPASDGTDFTLSSIVGKGTPVALFFFPKAGTSVCDAEACAFEASYPQIEGSSLLHVVGVSYGTPAELAEWKTANKLSYTVLSDEKRTARDTYKVGKVMLGAFEGRSTFFIGKTGNVEGCLEGSMAFTSAKKHVDFIKTMASKE